MNEVDAEIGDYGSVEHSLLAFLPPVSLTWSS